MRHFALSTAILLILLGTAALLAAQEQHGTTGFTVVPYHARPGLYGSSPELQGTFWLKESMSLRPHLGFLMYSWKDSIYNTGSYSYEQKNVSSVGILLGASLYHHFGVANLTPFIGGDLTMAIQSFSEASRKGATEVYLSGQGGAEYFFNPNFALGGMGGLIIGMGSKEGYLLMPRQGVGVLIGLETSLWATFYFK